MKALRNMLLTLLVMCAALPGWAGQVRVANYALMLSSTTNDTSLILSDSLIVKTGFNIAGGGYIGGNVGFGKSPTQRLAVLTSDAGNWATAIENSSATGLGLIVDLSAANSASEILFELDNSDGAKLIVDGAGSVDITIAEDAAVKGVVIDTEDADAQYALDIQANEAAGTSSSIMLIQYSDASASLIKAQETLNVTTSAVTICGTMSECAIFIVNGDSDANSAHDFCDIVIAIVGTGTTSVLGSVAHGSTDSRTYTVSGSSLQLTMGAGTYDVNCFLISNNNPG